MERSANAKSIWMLHAAVMLFGLSGVAAKFAAASAVTIAFGRCAVSACVLLPLLFARREPLGVTLAKDAPLLAAAGLLLALHWVSFFESVKVASVAIATIAFSTYPLFLVFLEPLVYREKFRKVSLLFALLLLAGVIVTIPEFAFSDRTLRGVLWGMLASLTYAGLSLFNRSLAARHSGAKISLCEQAIAAAALLPFALAAGGRPSLADVAVIAFIGVFCTALAFSLFVAAQKRLSAQTAGVVAGMEAVYGMLFAYLLLGDAPAWREILGGAVVLGAALAATWRREAPTP
ncbi:MAG: EamA-like transporter family protein [Firmicutes bacterium ADurb.Bin248]|nr:MAG: EamA-like transporter family protein [Firmicutes bacterium ADurb.Bin248]HOF99554.1 DMT family transporter [Clostridia bacterium]HPK15430.1 DMT family transporter [Clostridia bacterium]